MGFIEHDQIEMQRRPVLAGIVEPRLEEFAVAEQEFEQEDGTIRFKVAAPENKKADETLVKKLVDAVRSALEKK